MVNIENLTQVNMAAANQDNNQDVNSRMFNHSENDEEEAEAGATQPCELALFENSSHLHTSGTIKCPKAAVLDTPTATATATPTPTSSPTASNGSCDGGSGA